MDDESKVESPKITFHRHEIVGAEQTYTFMKRVGFSGSEAQRVVKFVRNHQFRFYDDSTDKAIKKWLQTLGKEDWLEMLNVRRADRKGNLANKSKPVDTQEMKELIRRCNWLIEHKKVFFLEDLQFKRNELSRMGVPKYLHKEAMANLLAIVTADSKKNQKKTLVEFIRKNYGPGAKSGNRDTTPDN